MRVTLTPQSMNVFCMEKANFAITIIVVFFLFFLWGGIKIQNTIELEKKCHKWFTLTRQPIRLQICPEFNQSDSFFLHFDPRN